MNEKQIKKQLFKIKAFLNDRSVLKKLAQRPLEFIEMSEDPQLYPLAGKLKEYQKQMLIAAGVGGKYDAIISDANTNLSKNVVFVFTFDHKINPMFLDKLKKSFETSKQAIEKEIVHLGKLQSATLTLKIVEP